MFMIQEAAEAVAESSAEMPGWLTGVLIVAIIGGVYLAMAHFTPLKKHLWSPFPRS